jgi:hypothetical protein
MDEQTHSRSFGIVSRRVLTMRRLGSLFRPGSSCSASSFAVISSTHLLNQLIPDTGHRKILGSTLPGKSPEPTVRGKGGPIWCGGLYGWTGRRATELPMVRSGLDWGVDLTATRPPRWCGGGSPTDVFSKLPGKIGDVPMLRFCHLDAGHADGVQVSPGDYRWLLPAERPAPLSTLQ